MDQRNNKQFSRPSILHPYVPHNGCTESLTDQNTQWSSWHDRPLSMYLLGKGYNLIVQYYSGMFRPDSSRRSDCPYCNKCRQDTPLMKKEKTNLAIG